MNHSSFTFIDDNPLMNFTDICKYWYGGFFYQILIKLIIFVKFYKYSLISHRLLTSLFFCTLKSVSAFNVSAFDYSDVIIAGCDKSRIAPSDIEKWKGLLFISDKKIHVRIIYILMGSSDYETAGTESEPVFARTHLCTLISST